jgi:outer membrane protein assembly factor BamB
VNDCPAPVVPLLARPETTCTRSSDRSAHNFDRGDEDVAGAALGADEQWPTPLVAAVTVTSGGMLFTGDLNNDFLAIDAANGKTLYRFNTGGSIGGG